MGKRYFIHLSLSALHYAVLYIEFCGYLCKDAQLVMVLWALPAGISQYFCLRLSTNISFSISDDKLFKTADCRYIAQRVYFTIPFLQFLPFYLFN